MTAHSNGKQVREFDNAITVSKYAGGDDMEKAIAYIDIETMCLQDIIFYPLANEIIRGYSFSEEGRGTAITRIRELDGAEYLRNSKGYEKKIREICEKVKKKEEED
ncbi:MAG: hypothetical protein ACE5J7_01815 [Candidatus Aenigmatarchaeota archaeon]